MSRLGGNVTHKDNSCPATIIVSYHLGSATQREGTLGKLVSSIGIYNDRCLNGERPQVCSTGRASSRCATVVDIISTYLLLRITSFLAVTTMAVNRYGNNISGGTHHGDNVNGANTLHDSIQTFSRNRQVNFGNIYHIQRCYFCRSSTRGRRQRRRYML